MDLLKIVLGEWRSYIGGRADDEHGHCHKVKCPAQRAVNSDRYRAHALEARMSRRSRSTDDERDSGDDDDVTSRVCCVCRITSWYALLSVRTEILT